MDDLWWRNASDLDKEQKGVMGLPLNGINLILGPPGCGKTNLLLLRANYYVVSGRPNIAVVAFNRTLKSFIQSGSSRYAFDAANVSTSASLFIRLLKQDGVELELPDKIKDQRDYLSQLMDLHFRNRPPVLDAILLDEAQDFTPVEMGIFLRLARNVTAAADHKQRIYEEDGSIEILRQAGAVVSELTTHYRNGNDICKVADSIGRTFTTTEYKPMLATSRYDEASNPSKADFKAADHERQADLIADRLKTQMKSFPGQQFAVLAPTKALARSMAVSLSQRGFSGRINVQVRNEDDYPDIAPDRHIWISTMHSAKGLEFRAVHIVGTESIGMFRAHQKRVIFTSVTRAKTYLSIYHDGPLPSYLSDAAEQISEKKEVSWEAAFGKP